MVFITSVICVLYITKTPSRVRIVLYITITSKRVIALSHNHLVPRVVFHFLPLSYRETPDFMRSRGFERPGTGFERGA